MSFRVCSRRPLVAPLISPLALAFGQQFVRPRLYLLAVSLNLLAKCGPSDCCRAIPPKISPRKPARGFSPSDPGQRSRSNAAAVFASALPRCCLPARRQDELPGLFEAGPRRSLDLALDFALSLTFGQQFVRVTSPPHGLNLLRDLVLGRADSSQFPLTRCARSALGRRGVIQPIIKYIRSAQRVRWRPAIAFSRFNVAR